MVKWRNGGMAEWWNGGQMSEWSNGGNAGMADGMADRMAGMAGMAEQQKEWQNGRMAEMATYVLFMVHADNDDDTLIF